VVSNVAFGLGFTPLLLLAQRPFWEMDTPWAAVAMGFLFFTGALSGLLSITKGDVSVSTPVMGIKAVLVAVFLSFIFGRALDWSIWAGSVMSVIGLFFMQLRLSGEHLHVGRTILLASLSAACYAGCDSIFEVFGSGDQMFMFLPVASFLSGVFALSLLPFTSAPITKVPKDSRKWLALGAFLLVLQGYGIAIAIGIFQDAAGANIVYSTRGMWSVVLVAVAGDLFQSKEADISRSLMIRRFIGAAFLTLAVVFVFM
jgi:drug/metabolite transporter (DMT)-like permease